MIEKMKVGIFVDSFYPVVDGVSQVVNNYCKYLNEYEDVEVTLITPKYPNAEYDKYEYNIYPYFSLGSNKTVGYRVGWPFIPKLIKDLRDLDLDIIHIHAPLASSELVRLVNRNKRSKVILTYHTKYDVDFEARLKTAFMRKVAFKFLKANVNDTDEVWIVSEGSETSLRKVGFSGNCIVMENGVDFVKGKASDEACDEIKRKYNIPKESIVFSFVGRMQWYKNVKLILDALKLVKEQGLDFYMLFIGIGTDRDDIIKYSEELGLSGNVIFTGSVNDRDELRKYYSLTDVSVFLSTFDTASIVVKESAACNCPCLFAEGSDSAYGVKDGFNGWFTEEIPEKVAEKLLEISNDREKIKEVGVNAGDTLYKPWKDAVHNAYLRYKEILNNTL